MADKKDDLRQTVTNETFYRDVLDGMAEPVIVQDARTGAFLDVNRAMLDMFGYDRKEALGLSVGDISASVPPYTNEEAQHLLRSAIEEGPQLFEWHAKRKSGELVWVEVSLRKTHFEDNEQVVAVMRDISDRKRAETTVQTVINDTMSSTGQEFLGLLIRSLATTLHVRYAFIAELVAPDMLQTRAFWADDHYADDFQYRITNTPCGNVMSTSSCFYHRNVRKQFPQDRMLVENNIESYLGHRLVDTDGKPIGVLVIMHDKPLEDAPLARHLLAVFAVRASAELDAHRREEQLRRFQNQIQETRTMESVVQIAGGVAHEFNNILHAMRGLIDMSIENSMAGEPVIDDLKRAREASQQAVKLTNQLLAFSRQQMLKPTDMDLNELVATLIKDLQQIAGDKIELDFVPGHHLGIVSADPKQIKQVLLNLCANSKDAMPDGGRITIESQNAVIDEDYCETHPWAETGHYVQISLSDNGLGMDKSVQNHAFEPFFTTKRRDGALGLGLATVYGIVKQHDGFIHIYSEPSKGTTVRVYLPRVERAPVEIDRKLGDRVAGGSETILIAEDDAVSRTLAVRNLESAGYKVLAATDGAEAIELFDQHTDEIDMAVLDVIMPAKSGRDVYEHIKQANPTIPFLFCSGYGSHGVYTQFVQEEGMDLLQKPYTRRDLLEKVRNTLDNRHTQS